MENLSRAEYDRNAASQTAIKNAAAEAQVRTELEGVQSDLQRITTAVDGSGCLLQVEWRPEKNWRQTCKINMERRTRSSSLNSLHSSHGTLKKQSSACFPRRHTPLALVHRPNDQKQPHQKKQNLFRREPGDIHATRHILSFDVPIRSKGDIHRTMTQPLCHVLDAGYIVRSNEFSSRKRSTKIYPASMRFFACIRVQTTNLRIA